MTTAANQSHTLYWNGDRIEQDLKRSLGAGLRAASIFLVARTKETLSVPAPRVWLNSASGERYLVAGWERNRPGLTKRTSTGSRLVRDKKTGALVRRNVSYEPSFATKGAPPRKLSGRLRASIDYEVSNEGLVAYVGTNVIYAARHEFGTHPFLSVTLNQFRKEIEAIVGQQTSQQFGRGNG